MSQVAVSIPVPADSAAGVRLDVVGVSQHTKGRRTLHDVSFSVEPGEIVAIVGGSGAGKTTLLETLVGVRPASAGSVLADGVDVTRAAPGRRRVGYVPQEDIIHRDLPLARTLRYAARLRLPAGTPPVDVERVVAETLARLDLADRARVRVGSLSGGQRRRASIAVEMLTRPRLFFLDEPTSGLDPAMAGEVLRLLRRLAADGTTILLTTHSPADIDLCDRVVFLARDGHLAFVGTPDEARRYFDVTELARAYDRLARERSPELWARRFAARCRNDVVRPRARRDETPVDAERATGRRRRGRATPAGLPAGPFHQWLVLTRRNADLLARNRLTLAVLAGSPALVVMMMAVLFRPGSFDPGSASPTAPAQTLFWVAFAGFFFGLTYGLLQIVGEMAVFRRERLADLGIGAYVASKVAVLTPVLVAVAVVMLGVLRALDRLPAASWPVYLALLVTIVVESLSALALGLLTSAAVSDASQATLALPMLCFPQVLFAGAVVPVPDMAGVGQVMSFALANRWAFESLGRVLHLDRLLAAMPTAPGFGDAFSGTALQGWAILTGSAVVLLLATAAVLAAKTRPGAR